MPSVPEVADDTLDERTRNTIATLDRRAQAAFVKFALVAKATAATYGCEYVAISGHRSWAEQDRLYAQGGVTKARGGQSNHNFGIAVDFGVFRNKKYLDEASPKLAERVHAACALQARGYGIEWGGDWQCFRDVPHYEIETDLSLAEKRRLYEEKGTVLV